MIWVHSGRMHWVSRDLDEVIMEVLHFSNQKGTEGRWVFIAKGTITGVTFIRTIHNHPLEAMRAGRRLWEQFNGKQSEETTSKEKDSKSEAKGTLQTYN